MPITCIVVGCGSRGMREGVSFHSVPNITNSPHHSHINELSRKRREMWLAAIRRQDLTESILRSQRVCRRHFIRGKPSALDDKNNPDWVPSQNMGHISQAFTKRKHDMDRKQRVDKRQKLIHKHDSANPVMEKEPNDEGPTDGCDGLAWQTDLTMEALDIKFEQLQFASEKLENLKCKIEHSPLGLMDCISDTVKWTYYTGFEYDIVNQIIFVEVKPFIPTTSTTFLSPFNRLLLTLVKLRLNPQFHDLAYRFGIDPTTASTYFYSIIHILYQRLKSLIIWPTRSVNCKNIPSYFTEADKHGEKKGGWH